MNHQLPFGFKFLPTDEELIDFYLRRRIEGSLPQQNLIMELDIYDYHPEILFGMFLKGSVERYFFTKRGRKYDNGKVVNRVAGDGFWKMTSVEKIVRRNGNGCQIGKKNKLKYFKGTPSKKDNTNWIMHEYEMTGDPNKFQEVVVCKIYDKCAKKNKNSVIDFNSELEDGHLSQLWNSNVPDEANDDQLDNELLLQTLG